MKNKLLIIIFGIILLLPIVSGYFNIGQGLVLDENRNLASLPKIGIYHTFPKLFTNYFSDNFGLRNWFIVADRWLRYKLFNVSPNKAITIGKDNWLFYTPDVNYIDSVNAQEFSQGELKQIKANLLGLQNNFKNRDIKFYFLLAPNKQSIYPEFLPDYMKKVKPYSRLDQLTTFLENSQEVAFINPKAELQKIKATDPVYLKYDTHWNDLGAFIGYQKLFQRISQDFDMVSAKTIDKFVITQRQAPNNDLAKQMGFGNNFKEIGPIIAAKNINSKTLFKDCPDIYVGCPLIIKEIPDPKLPKLVMFRDSFGAGIIPFISEHFQQSYFYWGQIPFNYSIVDQEKPDIVIMELTERELWRLKDDLFIF